MAGASDAVTAGEVFLRRLADHGVRHFFANAGTDFAPIVEAIARARTAGFAVPEPVLVPHETVAVGMAHGHYLATGAPQAVMVHTNVGLANAVMGALNAAADQVPILLASGLTPVLDTGRRGHRTSPVAWGQNMFDQAGLVREATKWDGALAFPEQAAALVDRAFAAALSAPRGPVYLGLPRETLSAPAALPEAAPRNAPARAAPHPAGVAAAAALLDGAERPLILAHRGGGDPGLFEALATFAEAHAIPVVEFMPSRLALSGRGPMHAGFDPGEDLAEADVVLVLDVAVPWLPHRHRLGSGAKIIQAGPDPMHLRIPVRDFPADLSLAGSGSDVVAALAEAMPRRDRADRFAALAERNAARRARRLAVAAPVDDAITAAFAARAIAELAGDDGRIVSELGVPAAATDFARGDQYFANPISGGLGWGLPAALGVQLADRDRLVIAALGDGSYIFANPVACHQVAEALQLPVLTVILNNGGWNAVRATTLGIFPDGEAARANEVPLTRIDPAPDYCRVAEASRAWTAQVERASELKAVLDAAARVVRVERRQAVVDVRTRI